MFDSKEIYTQEQLKNIVAKLFDKDKNYTIKEIVKITGVKEISVYKRREKYLKDKLRDPRDGVMRFNTEEIEILINKEK